MSREFPVKNAIITLMTDNYLSNIILSNNNLTATFDKNVLGYRAYVDSNVSAIKLKAYPEELGAIVNINGILTSYGVENSININGGENDIVIEITSESGVIKDYLLNVYRLPELTDNKVEEAGAQVFTTQISCFAWVNLDIQSTDRIPIAKYGCFQLDAQRTNQTRPGLYLFFDDNSSFYYYSPLPALAVGSYEHIGYTWDNTTGTLIFYRNGVAVYTGTHADKIGINLKSNVNNITIGYKEQNNSGLITTKDPRVYDYVLTSDEVLALFNMKLITTTIAILDKTSGLIGDYLTVKGSNIGTDTLIYFNGILATTIVYNPFTARALIPANGTGICTLITGGMTLTVCNLFTAVIPPRVPVIDEGFYICACIGDTVTITGNYYDLVTTNNEVRVNGSLATVTAVTLITMSFIMPSTTTGKITVKVGNLTGTSISDLIVAQDDSSLVALFNAASEGDTVYIPAGVYLSKNGITLSKNLFIIGAGETSTIFVSGVYVVNQGFITWTLKNGAPNDSASISHIGFKQIDHGQRGSGNILYFLGSCQKFRLHHCTVSGNLPSSYVKSGSAQGFFFESHIYGVIDHCTFIDPPLQLIVVDDILPTEKHQPTYGHLGVASLALGITLGSANAMYLEDNTFTFSKTGKGCIPGGHGGRYVFRHNTVWMAKGLFALGCDLHGWSTYGVGGVSAEIYNNTFYAEDTYSCIDIRGGTGVIFNNAFTGTFSRPIRFQDYRLFNYRGSIEYHVDEPFSYPLVGQCYGWHLWNNTYNSQAVVDGTPKLYVEDRSAIVGYTDYEPLSILNGVAYIDGVNGTYTPYTYPHPFQSSIA